MVELDEATRRALLAREGPPASARAEILAGLRTRLGGPQGPDDPDGADQPGELGDLGGAEPGFIDAGAAASGQIAWAAKVVGATLGLTGAGLLTIKLAAVAVSSMQAESPDLDALVEAPQGAAEPEPPSVIFEPAEPEQAAEQPAPGPAQVEAPARELATSGAAPSQTESTLAAELALIRAAKQLRDREPTAALAKLELHARSFPAGSLAPEREAIRVELLCALGRRDAAARARTSFLERHGDSPLRARVLSSCDHSGTDPAGAGD
ncbi:MAG: hypothetical protein R6X02_21005 [Enhygromyxa sp.]